MQRKTFDTLVSLAGVLLAVVLLVAGGLLTWGHNYITTEVHDQLAAQKIYFPPADSPAVAAPEYHAMQQYGGQQLTTGAQAEVYADHFIGNHLKEVAGGKTYAELSSEAQKNPDDAKLAGQVSQMFRGETLRGLLLNAYAFGTIGRIAGIAAIAAFVGAALLAGLAALGLYHARRRSPEETILEAHADAGA